MQLLDKRCLWDASILVCCNKGYIQHRYIEGKYHIFVQAFETGSKANIWWGLLNTCLKVRKNICYLYRQYTYIVYPAISKGPKQFLISTEISRNRRRLKRTVFRNVTLTSALYYYRFLPFPHHESNEPPRWWLQDEEWYLNHKFVKSVTDNPRQHVIYSGGGGGIDSLCAIHVVFQRLLFIGGPLLHLDTVGHSLEVKIANPKTVVSKYESLG